MKENFVEIKAVNVIEVKERGHGSHYDYSYYTTIINKKYIERVDYSEINSSPSPVTNPHERKIYYKINIKTINGNWINDTIEYENKKEMLEKYLS